jgi:hypothetical protein
VATLNQVFPGLCRKWFLKLKNSTREHLRQNTPPPLAEPPLGAQDHSLIYRRVAHEGKERFAPVANYQRHMRQWESQLPRMQDRALSDYDHNVYEKQDYRRFFVATKNGSHDGGITCMSL